MSIATRSRSLSAEPGLDVEPNYANNEDFYDVHMGLPEFEIGKAYESSRLPKATVTYTLNFSNVGTTPASGLVISDQLPSNVTWKSGGSYDASSQTITLTWPNLAIDASGSVHFSGELACSGEAVNDRYQVASSDQGVGGPKWGRKLPLASSRRRLMPSSATRPIRWPAQ